MAAGIRLTQWFKHEARRVYAMLDETGAEHDQRRLIEWIDRKGGSVTARDVQQHCRWLKQPGAAEAALEDLFKTRKGIWEPSPAGQRGHPTRRFMLNMPSAVYENSTSPVGKANSVDVDTVDPSSVKALQGSVLPPENVD